MTPQASTQHQDSFGVSMVTCDRLPLSPSDPRRGTFLAAPHNTARRELHEHICPLLVVVTPTAA